MRTGIKKMCICFSCLVLFAGCGMTKKDSSTEEWNFVYDESAETILTDYREKHNGGSCTMSITGDTIVEFETIHDDLCGSKAFIKIKAEEEGKFVIQGDIKDGEARILLEDQETKKITDFVLKENTEEVLLEKGEYVFFVVGRDFIGSFDLTGENITCENISRTKE